MILTLPSCPCCHKRYKDSLFLFFFLDCWSVMTFLINSFDKNCHYLKWQNWEVCDPRCSDQLVIEKIKAWCTLFCSHISYLKLYLIILCGLTEQAMRFYRFVGLKHWNHFHAIFYHHINLPLFEELWKSYRRGYQHWENSWKMLKRN